MGRTRYPFPIYMEGTQPGFAKRPVLVCAPFSWQSVAPSAVRGSWVLTYCFPALVGLSLSMACTSTPVGVQAARVRSL